MIFVSVEEFLTKSSAISRLNREDEKSLAHHLGWRLRQCITRCIADN